MADDYDPIACKGELKTCINKKINKATIMWAVGIFMTAMLIVVGLVVASFRAGILERQENTRYMIIAEAGKVREKLNEYCKKDTFHQADKRLEVLETNVGHIRDDTKTLKNDVKELKDNSNAVLKAIQRMERRTNSDDHD